MIKPDWPRFLIAGTLCAVLIFVLDILFHGTLAAGIYAGYPQRPMAEIQALFPFLFATYIVQLLMFAWLYLRLYPMRGLGKAAWWGCWGGLFVVIPNMQFFVAVRDTSWFLLGVQVAEGVALCVLMALAFETSYRPRHGG
ncbi:MAG: hypothetical protein JSS36_08710 [Proteobacteria bacterium]|nr:hypothetical protein [Pseudomonadota bacterium]